MTPLTKNMQASEQSMKRNQSLRRSWQLVLLLLWWSYAAAYGEEKTKVNYNADHLEGGKIDGEPYVQLTDHAVFGLEKLTIYADTAIYYPEKNRIEAYGNVKMVHEDGSVITADELIYEEKQHLAKLRNQVVYKSEGTTFYTDHFDYNTKTKQGHFVQGGKLVEGKNVLMSDSGHYNDVDKAAAFYQNVELSNQDYVVQCDTLHYNTATKIAQFKGPTIITSQDGKNTLTTEEGGEYNTSNQQSTFKQSQVETETYILYGDLLRADEKEEVYLATGQVELVSKEDDVVISGDYAQYRKKEGVAEVYSNPLMTKLLGEDTLYLSADTFVVTEAKQPDGSTHNTVQAYHNVKIYKEDLQGKADSMVYKEAEDKVYFYGSPIFWSNNNQLTAETACILLQDKAFHTMHMDTNAFVASEDVLGNYNQLQGRNMIAYFKDNKLDYIEIDGNAESIYFIIDDQKRLQGMNHLQCSHMRIEIDDDDITDINFEVKPVGAFYPPSKIIEEDKTLSHFQWRGSERPTQQEVVGHGYSEDPAYKQFKFNTQP